ncbi:YdeI/OmpD-associated family protein [Secundilactobacillus odoratitofui]|nr:YdeI/OmpD-associated family protein [Secundilactobacillus odoratitofui]
MAQPPLSDFEKDIPAVSELLGDEPALQTFFNALTPGYQREWARFIFGAKAATTKQRHIDQMKLIFAAGFKSKRAYDQRAK